MGGDEHGDDSQDGEDQQGQVVCCQAVLRHTGQVDAEEVHVLAELSDGVQLVCGEHRGDGGLTGQHLCDDIGVAGHLSEADAQSGHGIACGGDGVGADVEDALQRAVHDLDDAEHDEEVDQHGHTAGSGLIAVLLLELEQLFLLLFGLVLVLFLDVGDHRLESGHLGHALLLVELQRDADQADDDGEDDDVPAVVRDEVVDPLHHIAERYTEDVQNIHVSVHSAPPVVRDGYFYRRTRRPQFSTSQEAIIIAFPLSLSYQERCHAAGVTERFSSPLPPFFKGH